jgi:hypothetical protein
VIARGQLDEASDILDAWPGVAIGHSTNGTRRL